MPVSPAASVPPLSPGEMQLLLSRAGLVLNPGQVADVIASLPRDRPLADDMAYEFRLTPPDPVAGIARSKAAGTAAKAKTPGQRARPAAKAKAAPKRRVTRPAGRKSGKRGR